jgi:hypothetical protein
MEWGVGAQVPEGQARGKLSVHLVETSDDLGRVDIALEEDNGGVENFSTEHDHRGGAVANLLVLQTKEAQPRKHCEQCNREIAVALRRFMGGFCSGS